MPICAVITFAMPNGDAKERYDELHKALDVQANPPKGLISHVSCPESNRLFIVDVWESREVFDRWVKVLGPVAAQHGVAPPTVELHDVYNVLIPEKQAAYGTR